MVLIEGDGGQIWLGHFQKDGAGGRFSEGFEEGGGDFLAAMRGVNSKIQELSFILCGLSPGAESGGNRMAGFDVAERNQGLEVRIVSGGPLRGFGGGLLDAGDGGVVALGCRSDGDGQILLCAVL